MNSRNLNNEILEAGIREIMSTRYNVVTGRIEFTYNNGKPFAPITDRDEKNVCRRLRASGHQIKLGVLREIIQSEFSPEFNPFEEYFFGLPIWDQQTDYIESFGKLVNITNNKFWTQFLKKWIVGIVANCLDEEVTNHQMLIFSGGQGLGKTTYMKHLTPNVLKQYGYVGFLNPESKDAMILATETFICLIDELSSFTSKNLESFKQLVTQTHIKVRRPYAVNSETTVKRTTFCGTTNETKFLYDKTGNRRFLSFNVESVDLESLREFKIDNVYSQAFYLYMNNFQFWFDDKDNKLIEENNLQFLQRNVEEQAILDVFRVTEETNIRLTATGIRDYLVEIGSLSRNIDAQKIGRALTRLGFISAVSNGRNLYNVALVNNVKITEGIN